MRAERWQGGGREVSNVKGNQDTWPVLVLHPLWLSPFPAAAAQCGPPAPSSSSAAPPPWPGAQPPGDVFFPAMEESQI